jgi:phosphoglycolate phosphatase
MLKINRPIPVDRIKLLIFDLDGTLVDSGADLSNAVNAMLRHYGRPELPVDVIASYIGDGAPMLVRRALGDPDDDNFFAEAVSYFQGWYREHLLDNTDVYPGIPEILEKLRAHNGSDRKMAILSNKPVNPSRRIVEGLHLNRFFFQVYGGNSFHTKKPDPFGALTLCREAGVGPEEAVMVGDSANDVLAGRNAGMWTLGVNYGLAPQTLAIAPPDVLVDTPREIGLLLNPEAVADSSARSQEVEAAPPSPS